MVTLTVRPYAGDTDLKAIADFLNLCETVDQFDVYYSISDLRQEFTEPGFDPEEDVRLWLDASNQLIAFAQLWLPPATETDQEAEGYAWFRVHPNDRNHGLESEILAWAEARVKRLGQARHLPARLRTGCRNTQTDRILLFENNGFTYERTFLRMERSLTEPIPALQLPAGFTLSHSQGQPDIQARVDLHNQSFIDHWNFHPSTVEEWSHWDNDEQYRPELDLVAIAPEGTYAAYCRCSIDRESNDKRNRQEGHINILGTRREFRRQGLGRAMLLAGLHCLQAEGMEVVRLGVDSENPNQALKLYESVGFRKKFVHLTYAKLLMQN